MALTTRDKLRLTARDPLKSRVNEIVGEGDGTGKFFKLDMFPVKSDTLVLYVDSDLQVKTTDYTLDTATGLITFASAPDFQHVVKAVKYQYYAFSDDEMDYILDEEDDNIMLSAAQCYRILAGAAAKFFAWTSGDEKIDKSKVCASLLKVAGSLEERAKSVPYSGAEHWEVELEGFGDKRETDIDETDYLDSSVG